MKVRVVTDTLMMRYRRRYCPVLLQGKLISVAQIWKSRAPAPFAAVASIFGRSNWNT